MEKFEAAVTRQIKTKSGKTKKKPEPEARPVILFTKKISYLGRYEEGFINPQDMGMVEQKEVDLDLSKNSSLTEYPFSKTVTHFEEGKSRRTNTVYSSYLFETQAEGSDLEDKLFCSFTGGWRMNITLRNSLITEHGVLTRNDPVTGKKEVEIRGGWSETGLNEPGVFLVSSQELFNHALLIFSCKTQAS